MMMNLYWLEAFTPSTGSVAMVKGRMYKLVSGSEGTQSCSTFTKARTASTKSSTGISGMHRRSWVEARRAPFLSGRNSCTLPSGVLYAFRPSKHSCA